MKQNNLVKVVYILGIAEAIVIVVSLAYAFLGILGRVQVTIPIYFFWLLTHYFVNALFFVSFWRVRNFYSLLIRGLMIVWGGLVGMWYLPAAIFFVLTMNLNQEQMVWTNFVWMCEFFGIMGTLIGGYTYWTLRRFDDYDRKGLLFESPEKLYLATLRIPFRIAVGIVLVATLCYFIAALQLSFFAAYPLIERYKFVLHGFVTSLFVAIFYYHAFDQLLISVRKKIEALNPGISLATRIYSRRVLGTTMIVAFGGLCYIIIAAVQLLQVSTRSSREKNLQLRLNEVSTLPPTEHNEILRRLKFGSRGKSFLLNENIVSNLDLSRETEGKLTKENSGIIDDYERTIKLVGFKEISPGQKIVTIIYLEEFYAFSQIFSPFVVILLFILALSAFVAAYSTRFVTRAIGGLSKAVKKAIKGTTEFTYDTYSADELEELAHTFSYFVNESIALRNNLSAKIEEKTIDLERAKSSLETQNKDLQETKRAIINLLEDIEESKKEIVTEKAKDEALLSSILEGMVAIDRFGKVIHINAQAVELLGWSLPEAIGQPYHKIIVILDEKGAPLTGNASPIETGYEGKRVVSTPAQTFFIQRKNGLRYPASIIVSPIKYGADISGKLIVFRDITLEREVDRMKSEFISLASHQLRTPLSAMKWYLEMLLSGDIGPLPQSQRELIDNINQSNERMISLVRSLLNISRIESGRLIIDPRPTDMNEFVQSILTEVAPRVYEKKINLITSYHRHLPPVSIDAKLIREAFINLLTNAIKYTPTGGEVTVFISKTSKEIICQISDTGIGIPKGEQAKVFEKFFRASNVVKRETDGTGLGLYLAKIIIAASGGRIWFESTEGRGTTFWFSLPLSGTVGKKGEVSLDTTAKI